jgi:hypothetical protein
MTLLLAIAAKRCTPAVSPNKTLQRSGTHKLLGRGRPVSCGTHRPAARVLKGTRAAAELGR